MTASEGLLGAGNVPKPLGPSMGVTSGLMGPRASASRPEHGSESEGGGRQAWPMPSSRQDQGPQHFWIGSEESLGQTFPPVPRLPLGEVGELPRVPPFRDEPRSRGNLGSGLSLQTQHELAERGFEVVPRVVGSVSASGGGVRMCPETGQSSVPSQDLRFQTPRSSVPERPIRAVDSQGYPLSPGGTVIRPTPGPPPRDEEPATNYNVPGAPVSPRLSAPDRPEEPAKYISELPKLAAPDLSQSAVTCGNWLAQVRQVLVGLSPSAVVWWTSIEQAAGYQYQRWLRADPLDRLMLDPSTVLAVFDVARYQRVESRAVTLILAAIPTNLREEAVSNRWLSTASLLFRIQCVYQPGGSSERSMLLSQLVSPEVAKSCSGAVSALRKWQQHFGRVRELQAALPDASLLLKGVDGATASLLAQYPALNFRVNSFRNRASLDYNPSVTTVVQLVRLLQAEFESAALSMELSQSEKRPRNAAASVSHLPEAPRPPPLGPKAASVGIPQDPLAKALDAGTEGKGKGKGKDKGAGDLPPCYNFSGGKGCKYGDTCRFSHDRLSARKEKRCLACGQEGHFRPECPLVSPDKRPVGQPDNSSGSPVPVPPKTYGPKRHPAAKAKGGPTIKGIQEDTSVSGDGLGASSSSEASSQVQEALLAEASKILKGVTLKPCQVNDFESEVDGAPKESLDLGWLVGAIASASDPAYALVDSGATNALRPARPGELATSRVIQVDLASGAAELHISRHGTLLSAGPCQVILPAGYLVQLGYTISWKKKGCVIRKPREGVLEVKVVKGCPLISREVGLQLLDEYEALRESGGLVSLKKNLELGSDSLVQSEARQWLARCIAQGRLTRRDQLCWLEAMFPEAPAGVLDKVAGTDVDVSEVSLNGVPWNRRKRRLIWRAKPRSVLIHLFSGAQCWKCFGPVVEVEKSRGSDLLDSGLWQHLLSWAFSGVVGAVVGGPPCRTISVCRSATDGGPPPVRGRDMHRWGLPGLPGHLQEMLVEDSVLWLRTLLLYAVAQASAESLSVPQTQASGEVGEAKVQAGTGSSECMPVSPPPDVQDPVGLAQWAIRQAARNLEGKRVVMESKPAQPLVLFVWEHPRDPSEYMEPKGEPGTGWASWWSFPEWHGFRQVYSLHEAKFDQGKFGHVRPKPSTVATSSWFLFEALHGRCLTQSERVWFGRGPVAVTDRIHASAAWAKWAPGLTFLVQQAWRRWGIEQGLWPEVVERQCLLARLTEEELTRRHVANDHTPFKKGCPVCIAAQGRQRSHWRSQHRAVYSLSCDLAGPYVSGQSYDPVASGRDTGKGYKYFLAGAFTLPLPTAMAGSVESERPPLATLADSRETGDGGVGDSPLAPDIPRMDELFPPEGEPLSEVQGSVTEKAVTHRFRSKRPGAEELLPPEGGAPLEEPPLPPPADPPPVSTRTLCLGIPLRSKTGKEVLPAVQAMINKLEASGFPVHRYHADRAKELRSAALVSWCRASGIHTTWTPGDSPAGNRAELAVQQLKGAARKLLGLTQLGASFWPLAVLHVSNRNWCNLCEAMGIPYPPLLPFGVVLQARKRVSTGYPSHWTSRTVSGLYLGQAPHSPGGHLVWVADGKSGHKVMLTNTVYPVAPRAVASAPRFRVYGKRAPSFALKAVGMEVIGSEFGFQVPQVPPGGEWGNAAETSEGEHELSADVYNGFLDVEEDVRKRPLVSPLGVPDCDIDRNLEFPRDWSPERCLEVLEQMGHEFRECDCCLGGGLGFCCSGCVGRWEFGCTSQGRIPCPDPVSEPVPVE